MTIVEATRAVTGGIDTHGEVHVAAVLDEVGGLLGTQSFRADPAAIRIFWPGSKPSARSARLGWRGRVQWSRRRPFPHQSRGPHHRTARTAGFDARPASPIPSTRSKPRGRHNPAGRTARRRAETARGRGHPGPRRRQALGERGPGQRRSPRCANSPSALLTSSGAGSRASPSTSS